MEEFETLNSLEGSVMQGWTALDIQPRWHDEEALTAAPNGDFHAPGAEDDECDGNIIARTVVSLDVAGRTDPFDDAIKRGLSNEPLRGDRRSVQWEQAMQMKRKEISGVHIDQTTGLESYDSLATRAAVDETALNMRTALASISSDEVSDTRFRPRSDREENHAQIRRQFEQSANSVLGRSTYGNFGM